MAKLENKSKDNPRLEQRLMADGQISLYLEYYLGRQSEPVLDAGGEPVLYESGKMAGTPKYKVKHLRRKENLNLYLVASPRTPIDRNHNNADCPDILERYAEKVRHAVIDEHGLQNHGSAAENLYIYPYNNPHKPQHDPFQDVFIRAAWNCLQNTAEKAYNTSDQRGRYSQDQRIGNTCQVYRTVFGPQSGNIGKQLFKHKICMSSCIIAAELIRSEAGF